MRRMVLIVLACMVTAVYAFGQGTNKAGGEASMGYELYSWQASNGQWRFSMMASPSGVNVSAQQVFRKKFLLTSLQELKQRISHLPTGATIFWLDQIGGAASQGAGTETLRLPPAETIELIQRYANDHKIKVEVVSGQKNH